MKKRKSNRPIPRFLGGAKLLKELVFFDSGPKARNDSFGPSNDCPGMDGAMRWRVISSYGHTLERCSSPVEKESQLPYPKEVIRRAICQELFENPDPDLRGHLEVAYAQLESFVSPEEFQIIQDFKLASSLAHEIAKSGEPNDIIASARILKKAKGDSAVKITESISEKTRKRLEQIRSVGMSVLTLERCACSLD